jgi:hypothetical protein
MSLRPRRAGLLAAGLLTAGALIALGQPAPAATGRATGPAPVDAAAPRVAKDADEARHRVPNPLLKEILGEEDEGEGRTTRTSPRSARTSSASPTRTGTPRRTSTRSSATRP